MGEVVTPQELRDALGADPARTIVFTNGCFDVVHVGHLRYLRQARALGDALVVGLNSDASVRRIKGAERPFVPEAERAELLAALEPVDYVVLFDEDTPVELIATVRPDIHVKGGDYGPDDLPEAAVVREYGGRVEIVDLFEAPSTTDLVARIREGS